VKVLVVDDHRLLRESVCKLLAEDAALEVVGNAADSRQALELAKQCRPDVVLMDLSMPELNGIDGIRLFRRDLPQVRLVVLSMHSADSYVLEAIRLGVKGYVLKSAAGEELKVAVRTIAEGGTYFDPEVGAVLAKYVQSADDSEIDNVLSSREREVLQLIGEGKTLQEMARVLNISVKTARNHRDNIAGKLDCHSTAGLVKQAIRLGLTSP
jgi:DNA-binding NarL/FixJ family response regulator